MGVHWHWHKCKCNLVQTHTRTHTHTHTHTYRHTHAHPYRPPPPSHAHPHTHSLGLKEGEAILGSQSFSLTKEMQWERTGETVIQVTQIPPLVLATGSVFLAAVDGIKQKQFHHDAVERIHLKQISDTSCCQIERVPVQRSDGIIKTATALLTQQLCSQVVRCVRTNQETWGVEP